jgi:large-conductance mechanosensitive channel
MNIDLYTIIGNFKIIDAAVGYTLGMAFYNFIQSFFKSILIPLIDTFFDKDFTTVKFTLGTTELLIGKFIESFLDFILVLAFILFVLRVLMIDIIDDIIVKKNSSNKNNILKKVIKKPVKIEKPEIKEEMPKQTHVQQQPPPPPQIQAVNYNQHSDVYSTINGGFNQTGDIVPYNI